MTAAMDPLQVYDHLHDTYLRYLETSFFFRDPLLQAEFRELLRDPAEPPLVRRPIMEVAPEYEVGRSLGELVSAGLLSQHFARISPALPGRFYLHQDRGIERAITGRRNLVVATGTGSGKTEVFLLPILNGLLREGESGRLKTPGVRALLLYPMNALANDQVQRLRGLLTPLPEITFGRFTGETKETPTEARNAYLSRHGEEPLQNELIDRETMRGTPPHILLTNYAMLEYLLIRPKDSPLFSGDTWRFVVLDEVHTYSGAMGAEIAMLLRRLKDRVVASEPGRLQCIATSATLGRGVEDHPRIARFASDLFGEPFGSEDVIEAAHRDPENPAEWGAGTPEGYAVLRKSLASDTGFVEFAAEAAAYFPTSAVETVAQGLDPNAADARQRFLFRLLSGDTNLRRLQSELRWRGAISLDGVDAPPVDPNLLALATVARPTEGSGPLVAARYHIMTRAMTGVFVWLDSSFHKHLLPRRKRFHITTQGEEVAVFEIATCNRCGEEILVGIEEAGYLHQPPDIGDEPAMTLSWYALRPTAGTTALDEDDAVEAEEEFAHLRQSTGAELHLCRLCGRIDSTAGLALAGCEGHRSATVRVFRLENKPKRSAPRSCPSCGNLFGGVASRLLTGKEAPVAVLATALYQLVPPLADSREPGRGRKLIVFSDSRQDAAFFAPFMAQTYTKLKQRRYLVQALLETSDHLDLGEWARRARERADNAGEWREDVQHRAQLREAGRWVLREWTAWDRRLSLEGAGVAGFTVRFPSAFSTLPELAAKPWSLDESTQRRLLHALFDTLRLQGVVSFCDESGSFDGIEHADDAFAPRSRPSFVRGGGSMPAKGIHAWAPEAGRTNKRLDYLKRVLSRLGVGDASQEQIAREALDTIWRAVQHRNGPLRALFDPVPNHSGEANLMRLRPSWWDVALAAEPGALRCDACGTVTGVAVADVCPLTRCPGTLRPYPLEARRRNHFFVLFGTMSPIPLRVQEHTAQLEKNAAYATQQDFADGRVNILSCTTTFEMGVDVGDLHTVLLRNVPPSPGNYVQRAGRAGRRVGAAAVIVTYAQRRTHDLAYFERWRQLVRGSIRPPVLRLANSKIVRRHLHAEALAEYFRAHPQAFADRVDAVFDPDRQVPDDILALLRSHPPALRDRLGHVVPAELQEELGLDGWLWLDGDGNEDSFATRLAAARGDVLRDWGILRAAEQQAAKTEKWDAAKLYQRQLQTLRQRSLLGKLGTYGLMPKYGFPTEVVELRVRSSSREAGEVQLERDMKLALTEFAPGNQVIAAGKAWTPLGIVLPVADRKLHEFIYWHCQQCHYFVAREEVAVQGQEIQPQACHCGGSVPGKRYVFPEFGFTTGVSRGDRVGDARPPTRSFAASYFHNDSEGAAFDPAPGFPLVRCRRDGRGWIYVVNDNNGRDFYICMSCGFAALLPPAFNRGAQRFHEKPWSTEERCTGQMRRLALGYRFRTDVLELAFPTRELPSSQGNDPYSLWLSLLYAIVSAAWLELEIDERDLGGCLHYAAKGVPTLIVFDTCAGGAGFSLAVRENLRSVLRRAQEILSCRSCAEDSSCIACLRNYGNQRDHNKLRRGLALRYLQSLLGE